MSPSSPDKLQLTSVEQVATAHAAVSAFGSGDEARHFLDSIMKARDTLQQVSPPPPDVLRVSIAGGNTAIIKADIISSLETVIQNPINAHQKLAAQALLTSLTEDE